MHTLCYLLPPHLHNCIKICVNIRNTYSRSLSTAPPSRWEICKYSTVCDTIDILYYGDTDITTVQHTIPYWITCHSYVVAINHLFANWAVTCCFVLWHTESSSSLHNYSALSHSVQQSQFYCLGNDEMFVLVIRTTLSVVKAIYITWLTLRSHFTSEYFFKSFCRVIHLFAFLALQLSTVDFEC